MWDMAATWPGFIVKCPNCRRTSSGPVQLEHSLLQGLDKVFSYEANIAHRHILSICKQMLQLEPAKCTMVHKLSKNAWLRLGQNVSNVLVFPNSRIWEYAGCTTPVSQGCSRFGIVAVHEEQDYDLSMALVDRQCYRPS
ncbi:hypothetical protein BKA62DRAFT_680337 [Auriculariales sp. MPI-PUGE-AT-0066]|nr:hypothetical protein BKA62DRAFT_680337 [Auriculariales sp. MPI-PUGE-AT-0066]